MHNEWPGALYTEGYHDQRNEWMNKLMNLIFFLGFAEKMKMMSQEHVHNLSGCLSDFSLLVFTSGQYAMQNFAHVSILVQ